MACLMVLSNLSAQKQKNKIDDINYKKVAFVAQEKTVNLDQVVNLEEKNQRKKVYNIYKNHELKRQKLIRNFKKKKKTKYKSRQNRIKVDTREYDAKKDRESLEKLDLEVDAKILQALNPKQQRKWISHKKNEKELIAQ